MANGHEAQGGDNIEAEKREKMLKAVAKMPSDADRLLRDTRPINNSKTGEHDAHNAFIIDGIRVEVERIATDKVQDDGGRIISDAKEDYVVGVKVRGKDGSGYFPPVSVIQFNGNIAQGDISSLYRSDRGVWRGGRVLEGDDALKDAYDVARVLREVRKQKEKEFAGGKAVGHLIARHGFNWDQ